MLMTNGVLHCFFVACKHHDNRFTQLVDWVLKAMLNSQTSIDIYFNYFFVCVELTI